MLLQLEKVRKRYGPVWVLRDLSLTLDAGHNCRIHGSNGSGKSTALRIAAGLSLCDSGRVQRGASMSYVGHDDALLTDCTVAQNLYHLARLDPQWKAQDVGKHLDGFSLQPMLHKRVRALSQGTRRKVNLVLQLASAAPLMLADEPFAGLDESSSDYLRRCYALRVSQGAALLWTHHGSDPLDAGSMAVRLGAENA